MTPEPMLTTVRACRVAGIHRDRFNEHVADGNFDCAPKTIAGRARLFSPGAMLALSLFKRNLDDGINAERAGNIACAVAQAAAEHPNEPTIAYIETFIGMSRALPASQLIDPAKWQDHTDSGVTIRKASLFNVAQLRALIAHGTAIEQAIIGDPESD